MKEILDECIQVAEKINKLSKIKKLTEEQAIDLSDKKVKGSLEDIEDRFDEHLDFLGKVETIPVKQIIKLNNDDNMSHLMKHCVVAVMPKLAGEDEDIAFIGAHNICTWSLSKHGYVKTNGTLTGLGRKREVYHNSECKDRSKKDSLYSRIYKRVFKSLFSKQKSKEEKANPFIDQIKLIDSSVKDAFYGFLANARALIKDGVELSPEEEIALTSMLKAVDQVEDRLDSLHEKSEKAMAA